MSLGVRRAPRIIQRVTGFNSFSGIGFFKLVLPVAVLAATPVIPFTVGQVVGTTRPPAPIASQFFPVGPPPPPAPANPVVPPIVGQWLGARTTPRPIEPRFYTLVPPPPPAGPIDIVLRDNGASVFDIALSDGFAANTANTTFIARRVEQDRKRDIGGTAQGGFFLWVQPPTEAVAVTPVVAPVIVPPTADVPRIPVPSTFFPAGSPEPASFPANPVVPFVTDQPIAAVAPFVPAQFIATPLPPAEAAATPVISPVVTAQVARAPVQLVLPLFVGPVAQVPVAQPVPVTVVTLTAGQVRAPVAPKFFAVGPPTQDTFPANPVIPAVVVPPILPVPPRPIAPVFLHQSQRAADPANPVLAPIIGQLSGDKRPDLFVLPQFTEIIGRDPAIFPALPVIPPAVVPPILPVPPAPIAPRFFHQSQRAEDPANPVLPPIIGQWRGDKRRDLFVVPKFTAIVGRDPSVFPALPVIPPVVVRVPPLPPAPLVQLRLFQAIQFIEAPASAVIPFVSGVVLPQAPQRLVQPVFQLVLPFPAEAPASPVIQFASSIVVPRAAETPLRPMFQALLPFPAEAPANAVIQIIEGPWNRRGWPERLVKDQLPRFYPTLITNTVVETYNPYESFLQFDATQYTGAATVYFEVIIKSLAGAEVKARLFNITDAVVVPGGEITTTSTVNVRLRTSSLTLTGAKEYRAEVRTTAGETTTIRAARLIVDQ